MSNFNEMTKLGRGWSAAAVGLQNLNTLAAAQNIARQYNAEELAQFVRQTGLDLRR